MLVPVLHQRRPRFSRRRIQVQFSTQLREEQLVVPLVAYGWMRARLAVLVAEHAAAAVDLLTCLADAIQAMRSGRQHLDLVNIQLPSAGNLSPPCRSPP